MATKRYDLAIKTGEYESKGEKKGRYQNIGVVMDGEKGPYMLLNALFLSSQLNGIANRERRDSLIVSMFEPKDSAPRQESRSSGGSVGTDPEDDIPFAPPITRRNWACF